MKKFFTICIAVLAAAALLCGCGSNSGTKTSYKFEKTLPDGYPVANEDTTLTWWTRATAAMLTTAGNRGDTPFGQQLEEETGIKVKYIHPAQGQEQEQFNLMMASGELPDIVQYSWIDYPGGPDAAIKERLILPLNEIIEGGGAPNLKKLLDEYPESAAQLKTDEGFYYAFPSFNTDTIMGVYAGGMIRKDYLDRAGLPVPETVEELEQALIAFKEMGVEIPLQLNPYVSVQDVLHAIVGGFGIGNGIYVDDGKVKFGPLQPEYKQYVETMHRWYQNGLLDPEFAVENNKRRDALFVAGNIGVTFGNAGGVFGRLIPVLHNNDAGAEIVPLPPLTMQKGKKAEFGHQENIVSGIAAITTSCKNPELAARLLDYGYSDEGFYSWGFGRSGVSYNMIDGRPTYTSLIMNSDENGGLSVSESLAKYTGAGSSGPTIGSKDYLLQYYNLPEQQAALEMWSDTNAITHIMPVTYLEEKDSSELSSIKTDIDTYREEMLYKFINGAEPIENYDAFITTLKNMKVERLIELEQRAYDHYLEKK